VWIQTIPLKLYLITVQSTYNFTHAWHFLRGAMQDCDACHAALQRGPRQLLGVGYVHGISYYLPRVALPRLLLNLMFLALLYIYDVIYCINVYFTYFLCLAHTGWLWLRVFRWGDWRGGRFQLLMHTSALYYCVITHCTVFLCPRISPLLSLVEVKKFLEKLKLLTRDLYRLTRWHIVWLWFQFIEGQVL